MNNLYIIVRQLAPTLRGPLDWELNPKLPIYKKQAPQQLAVPMLTFVQEIVFHTRQSCKQQTNTLLKRNFSENDNMG